MSRYAGLDYGTSNCSLGLWRAGQPKLVPLEASRTMISSTLYAPRQDFARSQVRRDHYADRERDRYVQARRAAAEEAQRQYENQRLDLRSRDFAELRFGTAATDAYLHDPAEGFYVKSPKSFLGARGLSEEVRDRFVSVVAAMIANIRMLAQQHSAESIDSVVIGRPVNFQGAGGDDDNRRALAMLSAAAQEAGFQQVTFLFEPMAAAMEFEAKIERETLVLVVDIGGGTTDCSFVRVGPKRRDQLERQNDVLAHTGERLGGNDYDQMLAFHGLGPAIGLGSFLKRGLPLPNVLFMDAVSINDVTCQQRFYGATVGAQLKEYLRDAVEIAKVRRLDRLRRERMSYRFVRSAELTKVALTDMPRATADLSFLEAGLNVDIEVAQLRHAAERLLTHLQSLISDAITIGQARPDVIYLTGGMAKSPLVRAALRGVLHDIDILDSDHFASVTEGLTLWAHRLYGAGASARAS